MPLSNKIVPAFSVVVLVLVPVPEPVPVLVTALMVRALMLAVASMIEKSPATAPFA